MLKKMISLLLAASMCAALLAGCSKPADSSTPENSPQVMRMNIVLSAESQQGYCAAKFKEKLEELTDGRYEIQIFPNEQLSGGDGTKACEMAQQGITELDMHFESMWQIYNPKMAAATLPFLFRSREDVVAAFDNGLEDIFNDIMREDCGMQALGWGIGGFVHMVNTEKAIVTPDDLKGVKIRVHSTLMSDTFAALGANPVSMSASEVFTSLQQGIVDAAYNSWMYIYDNRYYEAAPYVTDCHMSYGTLVISMSTKLFDELPAEDQQAFLEAGNYAMREFESYLQEDEDRMREDVEKTAEITYLTPEQEDAFFETLKPFYKAQLEVFGEDIYKALGIDIESLG